MIESVTSSIEYIEKNLRLPVNVHKIAAQAANYSLYHFVRLFRALTGETPGSYLRKRRLSEAAVELVESDRPLIEIAADFQFQSHAAFTRSFKNHFGIPPSEQRKIGKFLHLTPRAELLAAEWTWTCEMEPGLVDQPALMLAGIGYHGDNSDGGLVGVWQKFASQISRVPHARLPRRMYGLWMYPDNFQTTRDFDYLAGLEVDRWPKLATGMKAQRLPASRYAVFEHQGSLRSIRQTYVYAYGEWLPRSGFQPAAQFDLECYDERFTGPDCADSILSILIPIT
jgi:AraC family transcriptional regulator